MRPINLMFDDVNVAYTHMQRMKDSCSVWEDTRNGRAQVIQEPVIVTHAAPYRRVLFDAKRDANPFFHYMEAIWMLAGSENVNFPAHFAANIRQYSDDGVTLHGAYGYRWRYAFEIDQIDAIIYMLKKDPTTRRAVISMWDPHLDLERDGKDLPCNTQLYFRIVSGSLNMTVLNRSNDMVWGMLGANIVHMSALHEYVARAVEARVGSLYQFTNNLHVYEGWGGEDKYQEAPDNWYQLNPSYRRHPFSPNNLYWEEALDFVEDMDPDGNWQCRILRDNAVPMLAAWDAYKEGDLPLASHWAHNIHDDDWATACLRWLERRVK